MKTLPVPQPAVPLDIEFPLKTRSEDATDADRVTSDTNAAIERLTSIALAPRAPVPFLAERLLSAHGQFGLDVEVKSEERVVGTWSIEVNPRDAGGAYVSQAKADLHVCASARGDARATGAFLVVRQWWVRVSDQQQLEQLYEGLSVATLERLDSLVEGAPNDTGESRSCVLFLVDGRRQDRKLFRLEQLQIRLLEDLESKHMIAGIDLRIAHGRGTGTQPHAVVAATLPAPMQTGDSGPGASDNPAAAGPAPRPSLIGEVFIRETVSPENRRWNRRASDRANAMLRAPATVAPATVAAPSTAAASTGQDVGATPRVLTSTY